MTDSAFIKILNVINYLLFSQCTLVSASCRTPIQVLVMVIVMVNVNLYSAIVTKSLMRCIVHSTCIVRGKAPQ